MLKLFGIQIWKLYKDLKKELIQMNSSIKSLCCSFFWETYLLLFDIFKNIIELVLDVLKFISRGLSGCFKK